MVAAITADNAQRIRDFHFMLVATLIHEVGGHVLLAFLSNGNYFTPFSFTPRGCDPTEAGLWLQRKLFGGTMHYFRDSGQDDGQVGSPDRILFELITNVRT